MPKTLRIGSCLVATVAFVLTFVSMTYLPVVDASKASIDSAVDRTMTKTTTTIDANDSQQPGEKNPRVRRMQKEAEPDSHSRKMWMKSNRDQPYLEEDEDQDGSSDTDYSMEYTECIVPAGKCTQCTFSEQKVYEACQVTGKWQRFECVVAGDAVEVRRMQDESTEAIFEMKSCKYTDFDEGIAMFELQIFCLLIGCLSFMTVRKHKRVSSSMFDRRKQQEARSKARTSANRVLGNDGDEDEIEFTPMINQEKERVPLMEIQAAHMEII